MFLLTIVLILLNTSYSQEEIQFTPPNYKEIEKNINDKNSIFYYKKLKEKFDKFDTNMTKEEMKYFYYGTAFQEGFNSYARATDLNEELFKVLDKENHTEEDLNKIIELSNSILEIEKFNLNLYNYILYAYETLEDQESFNKVRYFLMQIYGTIIETGDGLKCESAFHVIYIYNEYNILSSFGFEVTSQALVGVCDLMSINHNEADIDAIYFNISRFNMGFFNK